MMEVVFSFYSIISLSLSSWLQNQPQSNHDATMLTTAPTAVPMMVTNLASDAPDTVILVVALWRH
jgi:hypothetical protein